MIFNVDPRNQEDTTAVTVKLQIDEETCLTLTQILEELNNGLRYGKRLFKEHIAWKLEAPARKARVEGLKKGIEEKMNELTKAGQNHRQIVSIIRKEFQITWDSADLWLRDIRRELKEKDLQKRNKEILRMKEQGIKTKDIAHKFRISVETTYNIISGLKKPYQTSHVPRHKEIKSKGIPSYTPIQQVS